MFEVCDVGKRFAGVRALEGVSFTVADAVITSIIGPNGAGKSTLFNLMSGLTRPTKGQVKYANQDITSWSAHRRVRLGIGRTFQNTELFPTLNVLENVLTGRYCRTRSTYLESLFLAPRHRRERRQNDDAAARALAWVGLVEKRLAMPRELSYGEQRRVEIARALVTEPKTIMLDEPSAGMSEAEASDIMTLLERLASEGITVLLIEHNMRVVMTLSAKIVVLNFGEKIAEGPPASIQTDPAVLEAYLGGEE